MKMRRKQRVISDERSGANMIEDRLLAPRSTVIIAATEQTNKPNHTTNVA